MGAGGAAFAVHPARPAATATARPAAAAPARTASVALFARIGPYLPRRARMGSTLEAPARGPPALPSGAPGAWPRVRRSRAAVATPPPSWYAGRPPGR